MPTPGAVLEVSAPMSLPPAPPPPLEQSQPPQPRTMISPLYKQHSWSPDAFREQAWLRRKGSSKNRRSKSVTDEDLDELKACIELGFGFDDSSSPEMDQRLSDTLPALGLYHAVNKHYNDTVSKSTTTVPSSSTASERESTPSPLGSTSPHTLFGAAECEDKVEAVGSGGWLFGAAMFKLIIQIWFCLSGFRVKRNQTRVAKVTKHQRQLA